MALKNEDFYKKCIIIHPQIPKYTFLICVQIIYQIIPFLSSLHQFVNYIIFWLRKSFKKLIPITHFIFMDLVEVFSSDSDDNRHSYTSEGDKTITTEAHKTKPIKKYYEPISEGGKTYKFEDNPA